MTIRIMPPADGLHNSITVNGRSYSCPLGSAIDVPDGDAMVMKANGWVPATTGGVGTTAQRPAKPSIGQVFHDATLGFNIVFDGRVWRNPTSGATV